MTVPLNTTYAELIDIIYDDISVDKHTYNLMLQVKYTLPIFQVPLVVINRDKDVSFFLNENSISIHNRTPLCVSLVDKSLLTNPTQAVLEKDP